MPNKLYWKCLGKILLEMVPIAGCLLAFVLGAYLFGPAAVTIGLLAFSIYMIHGTVKKEMERGEKNDNSRAS